MCRLFALWANHPTCVRESLLASSRSLRRQSGGDRQGVSHDDGWGIGFYSDGRPHRVRSPRPALQDDRYSSLADTLAASVVLAHVRQASVGGVAEENTHPFLHGSWMFAHNGTLHGFAQEPERLRRLIPSHLRCCISGDTDSEHLFYFVLGRLEQAGGTDGPGVVSSVLADSLCLLAELFPQKGKGCELNCVLTDGRVLTASRWGRPLHWLERHGPTPDAADRPIQEASDYSAFTLASEPTTTEAAWMELPDRCVAEVHPDVTPIFLRLPSR